MATFSLPLQNFIFPCFEAKPPKIFATYLVSLLKVFEQSEWQIVENYFLNKQGLLFLLILIPLTPLYFVFLFHFLFMSIIARRRQKIFVDFRWSARFKTVFLNILSPAELTQGRLEVRRSLLLLVVAGLCTAQMKAALSPGPQRQTPTSLTQGLPKYIP